MGYCVASGGNLLWFIVGRVVIVPYRRLGTTYRSHLQDLGSSQISTRNYTPCPKKIVPFFYFFSRCPVCGELCKLH